MAVSLHAGIEKISYQSYGANRTGDFPLNKVRLATSAPIPSHVNEVFNLDASDRLLEDGLAPKISNEYVTAPAEYSRLFQEVGELSQNYVGGDSHAQQAVQAAQILLKQMAGDFQAFNLGRNALIKG